MNLKWIVHLHRNNFTKTSHCIVARSSPYYMQLLQSLSLMFKVQDEIGVFFFLKIHFFVLIYLLYSNCLLPFFFAHRFFLFVFHLNNFFIFSTNVAIMLGTELWLKFKKQTQLNGGSLNCLQKAIIALHYVPSVVWFCRKVINEQLSGRCPCNGTKHKQAIDLNSNDCKHLTNKQIVANFPHIDFIILLTHVSNLKNSTISCTQVKSHTSFSKWGQLHWWHTNIYRSKNQKPSTIEKESLFQNRWLIYWENDHFHANSNKLIF